MLRKMRRGIATIAIVRRRDPGRWFIAERRRGSQNGEPEGRQSRLDIREGEGTTTVTTAETIRSHSAPAISIHRPSRRHGE